MIPKIIHYAWFGDKDNCSKNHKNGLQSIKEFLIKHPDYQSIEWNDVTFDVSISNFTKQAYNCGNYGFGFLIDYVRWWCLYNYGGIWVDTDVIIHKSFDNYLNEKMCFSYNSDNFPCNVAIIMAEKNHPIVKKFLEYYQNINFVDGKNPRFKSNSFIRTQKLLEEMNYNIPKTNPSNKISYDLFTIYPNDVFEDINKNITNNTVAQHIHSISWGYNNSSIIILEDLNSINSITNFIYCNNGSNDLIIVDGPEAKFKNIIKPFLKYKKIIYIICPYITFAEKFLYATNVSGTYRYYILFENNIWYNKNRSKYQTLSLDNEKNKNYDIYCNKILNDNNLCISIRKNEKTLSIIKDLANQKIDNIYEWKSQLLNNIKLNKLIDNKIIGEKFNKKIREV